MENEIKVSQGGRIVIPKEIREKLGIKEGDKIFIDMRGREIVLRPKNIIESPIDKLYGSVKVRPESSPKKVAREWMKKKIEESS